MISVRINVRELAIIQHALTWLLTNDKRSKKPEVLRVRELNVAKWAGVRAGVRAGGKGQGAEDTVTQSPVRISPETWP